MSKQKESSSKRNFSEEQSSQKKQKSCDEDDERKKRGGSSKNKDRSDERFLLEEGFVLDCYDDVKNGIYENKNGTIQQSWFQNEWWYTTFCEKSKEDEISSSTNIQSLQNELIEIKRSLLPTAQGILDKYNNNNTKEEEEENDQYIFISGRRKSLSSLSSYDLFSISRNACNPYEILGDVSNAGGLNNNLFVNRSAIKLANINASMGFILDTCMDNNNCFHFVDLCGAPGGWSEYIAYHFQNNNCQSIKGYGFSLIGKNEHGRGVKWRIQNYTSKNFTYKICRGIDGTGDIYNWANVLHLKDEIGYPIHAVVCDGGMEGQRNQENQEVISTKLIVCEVAASISILSKGGIMIFKYFGAQTTIIRTMISDLITYFFTDFIVTKPISSRPASAERYMIMRNFRGTSNNNSNFNSQIWRDTILRGEKYFFDDVTNKEKGNNKDGNNKNNKTQKYLDMIDSNMLILNKKACLDIISNMKENVINKIISSEEEDNRRQHNINVDAYKREWML